MVLLLQHLPATEMLKLALMCSLNVASIMAVFSTIHETVPETYVEWKVKNFFNVTTVNFYNFRSSDFSLGDTKFFLQMNPNGATSDSEGYISLYLMKEESVNIGGEYHVAFRLGFKNANGTEFGVKKTDCRFSKSLLTWGWTKFIQRSTLISSKDTLVPKGILTVFCEARIVNNTEVVPETISSNGTGALSDNLKDLYSSKHFTDVTLIVDKKEFSAHKNILSCRLTEFGSMKDNITDRVIIRGCDPDSFDEFLLFVYSGKLVKVSPKKAMSLYLTAAKYNLQELKDECVKSIVKHDLNINSFYDIMDFANLHSDSALLIALSDYFIINAKYILSTEKWERFLANDPLQGNKLFLSYVEENNN